MEFTKTLNPDDQPIHLPSGESFSYTKNKSRNFDFDKYRKRIGGKIVDSSVSSKFDEYDKTVKDYKTKLTKFSWAGVITVFGTWVGLIVLVITTWSLIYSNRVQLSEVNKIAEQYKNQNLAFRSFALKSDLDKVQNKFLQLRKRIESLNSEKGTSDFSDLRKEYKKEMRQLEKKIAELEHRLKRQSPLSR